MWSLCAVGAWESRRWMGQPWGPEGLRWGRQPAQAFLIGNLWLKLACLRDQLLDGFLRGQDADESPLGIHFLHVLRQARRIAQRQFANRGDAGGADQADLGLSHSGNPHVVGDIRPLQQLLLADAGLRRERLASLDGLGSLEQRVGRANAKRFEFGSAKG